MPTPNEPQSSARVSTDGQTTDNQLRELRVVAERNGWQIVQKYVDHGGREQRPAFDALWKGATRREFDVVMVWAVDRLGRSLSHLVNFYRSYMPRRLIYSSTSKASTPQRQPARLSTDDGCVFGVRAFNDPGAGESRYQEG
jgi:DNA invertase Pin-like site-specific DNA recombinase